MQDSVVIKAPAKLNLFLSVVGKKNNGYHKIYTGITFLNLYDKINISLNNNNHHVSYSGPFKPSSLLFENDIITKILNNVNLKKKSKVWLNCS